MPTSKQRIRGIATRAVCACLAAGALRAEESVRVTVELVQGATRGPVMSGEAIIIGPAGERKALRAGPLGRFEPVYLAPGRYQVRATADGCLPLELRTVDIRENGTYRWALKPGGALKGVVSLSSGDACAFAHVFLRPSQSRGSLTFTDADGKYLLGGIRPGIYTLHILPKHYPLQRVSDVRVDVGAATVVDVKLPPFWVVKGTFTHGPNSAPLTKAGVTLRSADGGPCDSVMTDAKGTFCARHPGPGKVRVGVLAPSQGIDWETTRVLEGDPAEIVVNHHFEEQCVVLGQVYGPWGDRPVPGVAVWLQPSIWRAGRVGTCSVTGPDGRFALRTPHPGLYKIEVRKGSWRLLETSVFSLDPSTPVDRLWLLLPETAPLRGRVLGLDRGLGTAWRVRLRRGEARVVVPLPSSGEFSFPHAALGAHVLEVLDSAGRKRASTSVLVNAPGLTDVRVDLNKR